MDKAQKLNNSEFKLYKSLLHKLLYFQKLHILINKKMFCSIGEDIIKEKHGKDIWALVLKIDRCGIEREVSQKKLVKI
jgi:hypothetical protein